MKGVNLGNWLVLEKWMDPSLFETYAVEDEMSFHHFVDLETRKKVIQTHRDLYIQEEDFQFIADQGYELIRLPIPFFVFGDYPPYIGCLKELDQAFLWARKHHLKLLLDLHTVPGSQNGFDNGGQLGVCSWAKDAKAVEFSYTVLERLAKRYGHHPQLWGIEVLNEPVSFFVALTSQSRSFSKAFDFVSLPFLKQFYRKSYSILRPLLAREKKIVFHDGFRFHRWQAFFDSMEGAILDTHVYLTIFPSFLPIHSPWFYRLYLRWKDFFFTWFENHHIPVLIGEWCLSNRYVDQSGKEEFYPLIAKIQQEIYQKHAGSCFWNYRLYSRGKKEVMKGWSFRQAIQKNWLS